MSARDKPGGFTFWAGMAIGAATVAFGLRGILTDLRPMRIVNLSLFLGASGVAHDAVWAPLLVLGALATRRMPEPTRRPVRVALAFSAALALFAVPLLAGPSTAVRNPTVLPLDYSRNLVVVLAAIWMLAAVSIARSYRSARLRGER